MRANETTPPEETKELGFATFNNVPHIPITLPDGNTTITVKTSEGHHITLAFLEYTKGGPPQCVDICHHEGEIKKNVNGDDAPAQHIMTTDTKGRSEHLKDVLLTTVIFHK